MSESRPTFRAPPTAFGLRRAWYIAIPSAELGTRPVQRTMCGIPIAVFRGESGQAAALLDRCPHRGVPLTFGAVVGDTLQCGYHGWKFDAAGECRAVPGLVGPAESPARCVTSFPVREQQGFVWVWLDPEVAPDVEPFHFRVADAPGYTTVRRELEAPADLVAVAENALDVPHTAFLHSGLFRSDKDRNEIRCVIERFTDHVVAEYIGEPRPEGLAARLLSPSGGIVTHFDRFYLPSVLEVEYSIGDENHIVLNGACTPVTPEITRLFAVVSVKSRIPGFLIRPIVQPVALYIFGQDVKVLKLQTELKGQMGDRYVSTEVDLLGPHISRLLKRAEDGELDQLEPYRREVTMLV
ncbi:MAG: aromatic ring-hydroxylating dioxygenase subunit alpha [Alphaproteobacteria bacterium]|nr:aromatic ring-hydroxylating dioxygenase subunit alpha [Alphaproteobacteria bacterium]